MEDDRIPSGRGALFRNGSHDDGIEEADFSAEVTSRMDQTNSVTANLVLLGANFRAARDLVAFKQQIEAALDAFDDAPVLIMLDNDHVDAVRRRTLYGAADVLSAHSGISVTRVAVKLAAGEGGIAAASLMSNMRFAQARCAPAGAGSPSPTHVDDRFTKRECDIVECLRRGLPNKIIAYELNISEGTVKVHLRRIMKKLNVHNRTQAVLMMQQKAMIEVLPRFG